MNGILSSIPCGTPSIISASGAQRLNAPTGSSDGGCDSHPAGVDGRLQDLKAQDVELEKKILTLKDHIQTMSRELQEKTKLQSTVAWTTMAISIPAILTAICTHNNLPGGIGIAAGAVGITWGLLMEKPRNALYANIENESRDSLALSDQRKNVAHQIDRISEVKDMARAVETGQEDPESIEVGDDFIIIDGIRLDKKSGIFSHLLSRPF